MFFFSYGQKKTSLRDVDIVTIGSFPWILQKSHRDKQPTITAPHPCYQKAYKSTFHSKCKLSQIESKWVKLSRWIGWCDVTLTTMTFASNKLNEQTFGSKPIARGQVPLTQRGWRSISLLHLGIYIHICWTKMHTKLDMPKNHLTKSITLPSCFQSESNINEHLFFSKFRFLDIIFYTVQYWVWIKL